MKAQSGTNNGCRLHPLVITLLFLLITGIGTPVWAIEVALLVRPDLTAEMLHGKNKSSMAEVYIAPWRDMLASSGFKVKESSESILVESDLTEYRVIVLPSALCLEEDHLASIKAYLASGGGVMMTWGTGVRNRDGSWRGWDFLKDLIGAAPLESSRSANTPASLQMRWGLPGSSAVPPGYRIRKSLTHVPLYVLETDISNVVGYWADVTYSDNDPVEIKREAGLIVNEPYVGGRIAWCGANIDALHIDRDNYIYAKTMFTDLLRYLAGSGDAYIEPWPKGKQAGILVHGDIEDQFDRVMMIVEVFKKADIQVTYNLLVNEAAKFPQVVELLASNGSELAIHGDNHDLFKGQPFDKQVLRLSRAIKYIQGFSNVPTGFRPPELAYDETSIQAALQLGLKYITADREPDRDYPKVISILDNDDNYQSMVFFPKSELDDYDLFGKLDLTSASDIERVITQDYSRILDLRGLYKFNYHSQYLQNPELITAAQKFIQIIKRDNKSLYINTAKNIAEWIIQRESLTVETSGNDSVLYVTVQNKNAMPVIGASLRVLPPRNVPISIFCSVRVISQLHL